MSSTTLLPAPTPAPAPVGSVAVPVTPAAVLDPHAAAARLGQAVAELEVLAREVADLVAAGAVSALPVAALPALARSLHGCVDAVTAAATVLTGAVHASGAALGVHLTTKAWLTGDCALSGGEAAAVLGRAASLRDGFTATEAAWLAGDIPAAVVREITLGLPRALRRLTPADRARVLPVAEAAALEFATSHPLRDLRWFLARLRDRYDTDGADAAAMAAHEDQYLRFTPVPDGVDVTGYLTKETAAAVLTVLDQVVEGWYRTGSLHTRDQPRDGDTPEVTAWRRRPRREHLNALALTHALTGLLDLAAIGTRHEARPHLYLTVHADDLAAGLGGTLRLPGHPDPAHLTTATVHRILCDADVTPVLTARPTHPPGDGSRDAFDLDRDALEAVLRGRGREVLHVGRAYRTATAKQRAALAIRDQHCAFPGCRVDPSRCQAHHIQPWELGGQTNLDNLILVCHSHHHTVHEGGWTITANDQVAAGHPDYVAFTPPPPRP